MLSELVALSRVRNCCVEELLCELPVVIDLPEKLFGDGGLRNWKNIVLVNKRNVNEIAESRIKSFKDNLLRRTIRSNGSKSV